MGWWEPKFSDRPDWQELGWWLLPISAAAGAIIMALLWASGLFKWMGLL